MVNTFRALPAQLDPEVRRLKEDLRAVVQRTGKSFRELSKGGGLATGTMSKILGGTSLPEWPTLRLLLERCGIRDASALAAWEKRLGDVKDHMRRKEEASWSRQPLAEDAHPQALRFAQDLRSYLSTTRFTPEDIEAVTGFSRVLVMDSLSGRALPLRWVLVSLLRAADGPISQWLDRREEAAASMKIAGAEPFLPVMTDPQLPQYGGPDRDYRFARARMIEMLLDDWDLLTWSIFALPGNSTPDMSVHLGWYYFANLIDKIAARTELRMTTNLRDSLARVSSQMLINTGNERAAAAFRETCGEREDLLVARLAHRSFTGVHGWQKLSRDISDLRVTGRATFQAVVDRIFPGHSEEEATAFVARLQDTTNEVRFLLETSAEALWSPDGRWSDFQVNKEEALTTPPSSRRPAWLSRGR
ncbi:hypothetical protein ACFZC6_41950 [Streptomyces ossamyceticus]|uniref:hypothetical protein n=1 Tax=Streptomyces ossamyceticus TaxID=249581 RepID=UPI0036EEEBC8